MGDANDVAKYLLLPPQDDCYNSSAALTLSLTRSRPHQSDARPLLRGPPQAGYRKLLQEIRLLTEFSGLHSYKVFTKKASFTPLPRWPQSKDPEDTIEVACLIVFRTNLAPMVRLIAPCWARYLHDLCDHDQRQPQPAQDHPRPAHQRLLPLVHLPRNLLRSDLALRVVHLHGSSASSASRSPVTLCAASAGPR